MPARPRRARIVWAGALSTVLVVVVFLFVVPTGTYLKQRHQIATAAQRLRVLSQQNAALAAQVERLQTSAEIERLARQQYHMVRPGEQAYAILPAPAPTPPPPSTTTSTVHAAATNAAPAHHHAGALSQVWEDLTGWL